jgi:TubC N-terminal docking domain
MTLPELFQRVAQGDVMLIWQGETLHVSAPAGTLTPALKQALAQDKPVLRTWRQQVASWNVDTRELWEERVAIMEYDGGLPRDDAEWQAYLCVKGA